MFFCMFIKLKYLPIDGSIDCPYHIFFVLAPSAFLCTHNLNHFSLFFWSPRLLCQHTAHHTKLYFPNRFPKQFLGCSDGIQTQYL